MNRLKRLVGFRLTSEAVDLRLAHLLLVLSTPFIVVMASRKMIRLSAGPEEMLSGVLLLFLMVFLVLCCVTVGHLESRRELRRTRVTTVVSCSGAVMGLVILSTSIFCLQGRGLSELGLLLTCLLLVSVMLASVTLSQALALALKLRNVLALQRGGHGPSRAPDAIR